MNLTHQFSKNRKGFMVLGVVALLLVFSFLFYLSRQVETAFESPREFIPTRIYSNVTRIAPPIARGRVEEKFRALGYQAQASGHMLTITLHSPQYPDA
jgi:hypothetical protein